MKNTNNLKDNFPEFYGSGAVITGAASGMGKAVSLLLVKGGAATVLVDRDEAKLIQTALEIPEGVYRKPALFTGDVTRQDDMERLGVLVRNCLPAVDYLAVCAGILRRNPFVDIQPDEWGEVIAVNLTGCYLVCREIIPLMIARGRGAVVLTASMAGRSTSVWGGAHYTASKHGVIGLARHLAQETGPCGIRVNAFCPGGTLTPMVINQTTSADRAAAAAKRPLRRWATAEEQAGVIAFLLSDAAAYITGVALDANGGALMV